MTVTVSPMPHAFSLAEDFLSLDHWYYYGDNDREYGLRPESSVGTGNALWLGDSGTLRLVRDTEIPPGVPVALSWWAFRHGSTGPATVQLRQYVSGGGLGSQVTALSASSSLLVSGWNRCIARVTAPAEWAGVRISLFNSNSPGGMIAQLRAVPADPEVTES